MPQQPLSNPVSYETQQEHGVPLYAIRRTPKVVRGILVELTREMYRPENALFTDQPYAYVDPKAGTGMRGGQGPDGECIEIPAHNRVWINSSLVFEEQNPNHRPAIFVKLGSFQYANFPNLNNSSQIGFDLPTGTSEHGRMAQGSVEIVHLGHTLAQTDELLAHSLDLFDAFASVIRDDLCFKSFDVAQVDPPTLDRKEDNEKLRGILHIKFSFHDAWTLKQEAPILRRVVLNARHGALNALNLLTDD